MAYRGLNVFIADLRNAQNDKAAEQRRIDKEMANIRAKFTSGKRLESYSRKKYVWKMIYMFTHTHCYSLHVQSYQLKTEIKPLQL